MANAITLTSGMRKNLFSLQNTEKLLQTTQTRLATGLRVQKAVDDPINYFTALEHRQRAGDLSTRKDEMSESIQLVNAANDGVESINALNCIRQIAGPVCACPESGAAAIEACVCSMTKFSTRSTCSRRTPATRAPICLEAAR
jgi:hypothetical protein